MIRPCNIWPPAPPPAGSSASIDGMPSRILRGPNAHFHRTISESFFILSGTLRLFNGERWIDAKAGDFLYVPEGGIHGFHNESDEPGSMLLLFAPGAPREGYFEAIAEKAAGRQFSDEEWADLCRRHDNYFI